jgi:hypothetical protein
MPIRHKKIGKCWQKKLAFFKLSMGLMLNQKVKFSFFPQKYQNIFNRNNSLKTDIVFMIKYLKLKKNSQTDAI